MKSVLLLLLVLAAMSAHGDNLSIDFKAKDFLTKGTFTFTPGSSFKIMSTDAAGKPCELTVETKVQKENIIEFQFQLVRSGKSVEGGTIITQKGKIAKLSSGLEGQKPTVQFEAHWIE
jgi:hypothetical protein